MSTPTPDELDDCTVELIFILRDSLTDDGPDRLAFWTDRAGTALQASAAGSSTAAEAITAACRKLQVPGLDLDAAQRATRVAATIDRDFQAWAEHVARNAVYVVALARVANDERKTARKAARKAAGDTIPF